MNESDEDFVKGIFADAIGARRNNGVWTIFGFIGGDDISSGVTPQVAWADAVPRFWEEDEL